MFLYIRGRIHNRYVPKYLQICRQRFSPVIHEMIYIRDQPVTRLYGYGFQPGLNMAACTCLCAKPTGIPLPVHVPFPLFMPLPYLFNALLPCTFSLVPATSLTSNVLFPNPPSPPPLTLSPPPNMYNFVIFS